MSQRTAAPKLTHPLGGRTTRGVGLGALMTTGEQNLQMIRAIEANRAFLLLAYASNPDLLAKAEPRIRQLFEPLPPSASFDDQRHAPDA